MIEFLGILALIGLSIADPIPGISTNSSFPDGRIIGGENTSIEEVPYQVSIGVYGVHYCGGSIIAKDWILTAGHCASFTERHYTVRAGSDETVVGGTLHRVSLVIRHENYKVASRGIPLNDIALFRIDKPFVLDKAHRAIELYKKNEDTKVGVYSVITGWGTTSPTENISPRILQTVTVPIISKKQCHEAYSHVTNINPGQICAGYPQGGKDACQGDSGGPLVVQNRLAGVVSWGNGCAVPGYPGVYTEVAYFREWIDRSIKR